MGLGGEGYRRDQYPAIAEVLERRRIPKQALRATSKPAPSLVRCSQVAHFIGAPRCTGDLSSRSVSRYALLLAPPRADHRPQAVSRPVVPKRDR